MEETIDDGLRQEVVRVGRDVTSPSDRHLLLLSVIVVERELLGLYTGNFCRCGQAMLEESLQVNGRNGARTVAPCILDEVDVNRNLIFGVDETEEAETLVLDIDTYTINVARGKHYILICLYIRGNRYRAGMRLVDNMVAMNPSDITERLLVLLISASQCWPCL